MMLYGFDSANTGCGWAGDRGSWQQGDMNNGAFRTKEVEEEASEETL
jgi:hypothetical protein